jgi:hypothetical protein
MKDFPSLTCRPGSGGFEVCATVLQHSNMSIPDRGPELLAVNISFVAVAILAYSLRCFVRLKMVKAFGMDDWLMGVALV